MNGTIHVVRRPTIPLDLPARALALVVFAVAP